MGLSFFDTLQRKKVPFEPHNPGEARLYTCGPTVYNDAHIGNFRTYIFEDLLRRTLEFSGYRVIQVMNLTDVDDKTIRAASAAGIPLQQQTAPIIERFFEDIDTLGIQRAHYYPRATEHVDLMIEMAQTLLDKGYAYESEGSIYFSIAKFPEYGRLSGMKLESLARGVRIDADEYEKDDCRDFALWKAWSEEDGDVWWDSPFGKGRPGWHIECSAMSMKYLGSEFDIHTGGVDNIFPHHENEIAQSVCATGKGFVRYWLHSEHIVVRGEKMSKSLRNIITLRELVAQGYSPRVIRFTLLSTHYRQRMNVSDETLAAGQASLARLDTLRHAAEAATSGGEPRSELIERVQTARQTFTDAIQDDLGIAGALAAMFDLVSDVHRLETTAPLKAAEGAVLLDLWHDFDRALGVLFPMSAGLDSEIKGLVLQRLQSRKNKDFCCSDDLRKQLSARGYEIKDTACGTEVVWARGREVVTL